MPDMLRRRCVATPVKLAWFGAKPSPLSIFAAMAQEDPNYDICADFTDIKHYLANARFVSSSPVHRAQPDFSSELPIPRTYKHIQLQQDQGVISHRLLNAESSMTRYKFK
jgi:hypothetical protein